MNEDYVSYLKAFLLFDYMLSDESERIKDPILDETKLKTYLKSINMFVDYAKSHDFEVDFDDPRFPKSMHMMTIKFITREKFFEVQKEDMRLFEMITCSDGVIMNSDGKGDVVIDLFYEDIYKERR